MSKYILNILFNLEAVDMPLVATENLSNPQDSYASVSAFLKIPFSQLINTNYFKIIPNTEKQSDDESHYCELSVITPEGKEIQEPPLYVRVSHHINKGERRKSTSDTIQVKSRGYSESLNDNNKSVESRLIRIVINYKEPGGIHNPKSPMFCVCNSIEEAKLKFTELQKIVYEDYIGSNTGINSSINIFADLSINNSDIEIALQVLANNLTHKLNQRYVDMKFKCNNIYIENDILYYDYTDSYGYEEAVGVEVEVEKLRKPWYLNQCLYEFYYDIIAVYDEDEGEE